VFAETTAYRKGRPKGIDPATVREIRAAAENLSYRKVAEKFDISATHVSNIVHRRVYADIE